MTISLKNQIRNALIEALDEAGWNQKQAAILLDISPRKMNYMMMRLGIPRPTDKQKEK